MGDYSSRVIQKIIVLFIVMIAGYICKKSKILDQKSTKALSSMLAYVTNPCLAFCSLQIAYTTDTLKEAVYILILSLIIHSVMAVVTHFSFRFIKDSKSRSVYSFAMMYANCGFMGFPLMVAIFGDIGLFYGVIYTVIFNIFNWTHGIVVMDTQKGKLPWKKLIFNPTLIAVFIGIGFFIARVQIPATLKEGLTMVGDMTFPLSMIIIGSLLADMKLLKILAKPSVYLFSAVKLLVLPAIMLVAAKLLNLPEFLAITGVTMCAAPSAATTAVLAEVYDNDSALAARLVGITTLLCLLTMPFMLKLAEKIL